MGDKALARVAIGWLIYGLLLAIGANVLTWNWVFGNPLTLPPWSGWPLIVAVLGWAWALSEIGKEAKRRNHLRANPIPRARLSL